MSLFKKRKIQMYAGEPAKEIIYFSPSNSPYLSETTTTTETKTDIPKVDISNFLEKINDLKDELTAEQAKPKYVNPHDTHEYKSIKIQLENWTNIFNSSTYPTPRHVAQKIIDLQTKLASKIDISPEDQKKIKNFNKIKLERDNLEADTNNQKKNFQAEIKRLSVEIAHKDENNAKSHQAFIAKTEEVNNLSKQLKKEQEQSNKLKVNVQNLTNEKRFLEQQEKTNSELKNRELNQSRVKIGELEEQINNLLEKSNQQEDYIEQTKSEKRQLEKEFENIKRDRETKVEELREAEWEIKRITNELELAKNQKDRTDFDILTSYTIDQWIEKWKQSNKSFPLLSNPEELFLHLESHRDDYKESYNIMGLNQISRQLLTKKYEQSPEWKETQRMLELQKTPRTINDWFKEGFIRQEQLDKIHELSRRGIKTIDFNKLYDWGEITKMILATGVID